MAKGGDFGGGLLDGVVEVADLSRAKGEDGGRGEEGFVEDASVEG